MRITITYDQMHLQLPSDECCVFEVDQEMLVCSLSGLGLTEPVIASDGYTYERRIIDEYCSSQIDKNNIISPRNGQILLVDNYGRLILRRNIFIESIIYSCKEELLEAIHNGITSRSLNKYNVENAEHSQNKLLSLLIDNFLERYFKLYEVMDLEVRNIFKLLRNGERALAKSILRKKPDLAFKPLTDSGGEYLLHFFGFFGDLDMIRFLVEEIHVPLNQKSSVHGLYLFFYLRSKNGIEICDYCIAQGLSISLTSNNKKIDFLSHGVINQDLDLIKHAFAKGFIVREDKEYIDYLQKVLAVATYEIILYVASELKKSPQIIKSLSFIHELSKNHVLSMQQLAEIFIIFGNYLQYSPLVPANPYCLGILRRNKRYLRVLGEYFQHLNMLSVIDHSALNNQELALPLAINLDMIDGNMMQFVELLLSLGANPNVAYKNSKSYPLSRAILNDNPVLFAKLRNYNVNIQSLLIIEIIPALFLANSFSKDDFIFILRMIDVDAFNIIFGLNSNKEILISGIIDHDSVNLLLAFEHINNERPDMIDPVIINPIESKIGNVLHIALSKHNLKFAIHFALRYPELMWQSNIQNYNPLQLALLQCPLEIILEMIKIASGQGLSTFTSTIRAQSITTVLENNPMLSLEQKAWLIEYISSIIPPVVSAQLLCN